MSYIIFGCTTVLILVLFFAFRKFFDKNKANILKGISLILALVFFIRYFASEKSLFNQVLHLTVNNPFSSPFLCFMTSLCVWLAMASVVILSMYPFFKQFAVVKNLAKTLSLFSSVLNIAFLPFVIYSFTGSYGFSLCGVFIEIEVAISLLYSVYILWQDGWKIPKKELIEMLCALPIVLLFSMPPYILNTYFGSVGTYNVKEFALYHRVYLYIAFIILVGLYLLLKRKDKEYSRMVLLFISLATLISYCYDYDFSRFITPSSWPLHLCNTAMFIIPLCLIFRMKRLFYFTFFINVLGAFLAMLMPNYNEAYGVFSHGVVRFWINHIMAFAMPLLIVLLRVYERPKLRQFMYSMLWFLAYFVFVLIVNAYFTAVGTPTDFFFVNSNFIAEKLGRWAERLLEITLVINIGGLSLTFYPVYQVLFFLVYVVLGLAMWFVYAWLFQIQDFYLKVEEKNRKIKVEEYALCAKYNQKEIDKCMNKESENKLVVKNVYKSYGDNKYYSVTDANLEVNAGEIFGFLGPNGAGKSTIIKCIVGIQPVSKGSIEINGYDIEKQPVKAKEQLGFVPDHYALYEKLTGREYINYVADLYNVSKKDRDERLNKYVKMLQMEHAFDNQIRTYSHGMKQKIAIMSALVHNPKLWILDEPLTGLDPTSIYQVKECMKEHARNGNIVFFSSHIIDIVEKLCDRIMIIKKGRIRTSVTLEELRQQNISLEDFYLNIINDSDDEQNAVEVDKAQNLNDGNKNTSAFFANKPSLFSRIKAKINAKKQKSNSDASELNEDFKTNAEDSAETSADNSTELNAENLQKPNAENSDLNKIAENTNEENNADLNENNAELNSINNKNNAKNKNKKNTKSQRKSKKENLENNTTNTAQEKSENLQENAQNLQESVQILEDNAQIVQDSDNLSDKNISTNSVVKSGKQRKNLSGKNSEVINEALKENSNGVIHKITEENKESIKKSATTKKKGESATQTKKRKTSKSKNKK